LPLPHTIHIPQPPYLDRVGEGVPDVESAGDIGRRDDDHKGGLVRVDVRLEEPALLPPVIPAVIT
jgi:hypothetical protein